MHALTLLGPQRRQPTLADVFERLGVVGPVAAITAGWQEREGENETLAEHLGCSVVDLRLHERLEEVFAVDPVLFRAHRERQNLLRELQRLYRYRLDFAIEPARALLGRDGDRSLLVPEREAAIAALRRLDAEHLVRIAAIHREFEHQHHPRRRQAVRRHRLEIAGLLESSAALAIAGGHVAVLVNRMRLFGLADFLDTVPVFAWSAGAMALGERIVLFHDSPPWGAGNAEVLDAGLGLYDGVVPLPDASRRLRLTDATRIELFARRFAPAACLTLDDGDASCRGPGSCSRPPSGGTADLWRPLAGGRRLTLAGEIRDLEAA